MLITTVNKLYRRGAKRNIQRILVKTHTADVAEVIQYLETGENLEVLRLEPSLEKRARIISHLKAETQQELLYMMEPDEANDLVSRMDTDDAADVLGNLPEELSSRILQSMERENSEEVTDLMGYPEDSAGGLMNSDFLALGESLTVAQAIEAIQGQDSDAMILFYVYVVDEQEQLVGVLSLKQLLLAKPTETLKSVASSDVITVSLDTDQQEVAMFVERYDFLALPVVDDAKKLMGVITVDDVIDVIREEAEEDLIAMGRAGWSADAALFEHVKARLPWLSLTFLGGLICYALMQTLVSPEIFSEGGVWWYAAASLPLLLSLGATSGNQAISIALGVIRGDSVASLKVIQHWLKEMRISLFLALFFSALILLGGTVFFGDFNNALMIAAAVGLQIFLSVTLGALIPMLLKRSGVDPTISSIPIYTFLADIISVLIAFGLVKLFLRLI